MPANPRPDRSEGRHHIEAMPRRISRRRALTLLASTPLALVGAACLGSDNEPATILVDGTPLPPRGEQLTAPGATAAGPAPVDSATPVPFTPTPPISDLDPDDLTGFTYPIEGACLPSRDETMPNAARPYRHGINEGVDFYHGDVCTEIFHGQPVLAMYQGVVVRAMHDYENITPALVTAIAGRTEAQGYTDEESLDIYRGRQVWIDHGNGVVSRYCNLDAIEESIAVGVYVTRGTPVGTVGDSGTPESITDPGAETHLHAEVRVDDSFLGADLDPVTVRALYEQLFTATEPADTDAASTG